MLRRHRLFVSNVDNLGASADLAILQHLDESQTEFLVELTPKTKADVKGGTLIEYNGRVRLLEVAQVPSQYRNEFYSIRKFSTFNTNKLGSGEASDDVTFSHKMLAACGSTSRRSRSSSIGIPTARNLTSSRTPRLVTPSPICLLDLIRIPIVPFQTTDAGEAVIQLETAMASAVQSFTRSGGLLVPRSRFVPVKSTSDLLLAQSEGLYSLKHGQLVVNPARPFGGVPVIKLGNEFARVSDYDKRCVEFLTTS